METNQLISSILNDKKLLSNINDYDTLITSTVTYGLDDLLRLFVLLGADINSHNLLYHTLITKRSVDDKKATIDLLIELGININIPLCWCEEGVSFHSPMYGQSYYDHVILWLVNGSHHEDNMILAEYILNNDKVKIHSKSIDHAFVDIAYRKNDIDSCKFLLKYGANIDYKHKKDKTVLMKTCRHLKEVYRAYKSSIKGHHEFIIFLVDNGAKVDNDIIAVLEDIDKIDIEFLNYMKNKL